MKTNTLKITLAALLAQTMCMSVVLSHMHAKDAVSMMSIHSNSAARTAASTTDVVAKAIGDLHHHIDKAGLKNINVDSGSTAARTRELNPLNAEIDEDTSLSARFHDFLLRFRIVGSLIYEYV